jgi:hypothetical protein
MNNGQESYACAAAFVTLFLICQWFRPSNNDSDGLGIPLYRQQFAYLHATLVADRRRGSMLLSGTDNELPPCFIDNLGISIAFKRIHVNNQDIVFGKKQNNRSYHSPIQQGRPMKSQIDADKDIQVRALVPGLNVPPLFFLSVPFRYSPLLFLLVI